jgi:hypothetical protein
MLFVLQGSLTVGYLNTVDQVVCLVSQGQFTHEQLGLALSTATEQVGSIRYLSVTIRCRSIAKFGACVSMDIFWGFKLRPCGLWH